MPLLNRIAPTLFLANLLLVAVPSDAQNPTAVCHPRVTNRTIVATPTERYRAGERAQPSFVSADNGFDWPDTPLGVIKTGNGYEFFASNGGNHARQEWQGHWVGNDKSGSVVATFGTLDKPLGDCDPQDITIAHNPNAAINPNYPSYGYMGGGPVYQIAEKLYGPGHLLATYHAELPNDALYAALGLAASSDYGRHWTDLGEIIRLNQAYAVGLDGFEIGDGPLVLSPDGQYFYLYFPDWLANGTLHTTNAGGQSTINNVSVARAPIDAVIGAAFDAAHPHAVPFQKFYEGHWDLQPANGGASTDLLPKSAYQGYIDVHYNPAIQRYVMLLSNDTQFAYAESIDALHWSTPELLGTFGPIAAYPTAVGLGSDPHLLGKQYYVYFTHLPTDGAGWTDGSLQRLTLTCP
jgi:hypothetical protein